jgi:hypothetical protein
LLGGFLRAGLGLGCGGVASIRLTTSSRRFAISASLRFSDMATPKSDTISEPDYENTLRIINDPQADPRVIAVVAASFCEDYLGRMVRTQLPGLTTDLRKRMFENGMLSQSSERAQMARALGLINADCHADLSLIAKIRNLFAHNIYVASFDHKDVADLCDDLRCPKIVIEKRIKVIGATPDAQREVRERMARNFDLSPRGRFTWTAVQLGMTLHNSLLALQRS